MRMMMAIMLQLKLPATIHKDKIYPQAIKSLSGKDEMISSLLNSKLAEPPHPATDDMFPNDLDLDATNIHYEDQAPVVEVKPPHCDVHQTLMKISQFPPKEGGNPPWYCPIKGCKNKIAR